MNITGSDRELAILTIETLTTHLRKLAAGPAGSGPFTPAQAYALTRGLRLIKKTLFPPGEQQPSADEHEDD